MWVYIDIVEVKDAIIFLPRNMYEEFNDEVKVRFGKKHAFALLMFDKKLQIEGGESFEHPMHIKVSDKLASKLCLQGEITYQIKYRSSRITIGPAIGLLLGGHNYIYSPRHMEKYSDRFGVYGKVGGLVYAFSHKSIDWKNKEVYGLFYNYSKSKWQYGKFPFPSVIYRRDFHTDSDTERRLTEFTKGRMFNSWRFSKFHLYQYVKRNKGLAKYLPETELSKKYEQVLRFIEKHKDVILKPINLSRGRGICIISSTGSGYRIYDYRSKEAKEIELQDSTTLKSFFEANPQFFSDYLIQRYLKLAKVDGAAFDIRVVMQKDTSSDWKCTGIECRVAGKESLLTNISRGGYALTLDEALSKAFPDAESNRERIKTRIHTLCHKLCINLEGIHHHFAELGMDIAADEKGRLWIIEVNVFPSFKGFKVMDYDTYLGIRYTPMLYAAQLAGFSIN
jgi:glutathione synthase/RimK-type ligase-like ATP-grasp enzyme